MCITMKTWHARCICLLFIFLLLFAKLQSFQLYLNNNCVCCCMFIFFPGLLDGSCISWSCLGPPVLLWSKLVEKVNSEQIRLHRCRDEKHSRVCHLHWWNQTPSSGIANTCWKFYRTCDKLIFRWLHWHNECHALIASLWWYYFLFLGSLIGRIS